MYLFQRPCAPLLAECLLAAAAKAKDEPMPLLTEPAFRDEVLAHTGEEQLLAISVARGARLNVLCRWGDQSMSSCETLTACGNCKDWGTNEACQAGAVRREGRRDAQAFCAP